MNLTPLQVHPIPLRGDKLSTWYAAWLCPPHLAEHYRAIGDWAELRLRAMHTTAALRRIDGRWQRPFFQSDRAPAQWHPHLFARRLTWRRAPDFRNPRHLTVRPVRQHT